MREFLKLGLASVAADVARRMLLVIGVFALAGAQAATGADAQTLGIVTIVDGRAQLLRDDKRMQIEEGVRLQTQDVIETASDARITRIEFTDGLAFNLGPATRVLVDPQFYGERGRFARLYLLSGWIKMKAGTPAAATKDAEKPIPLLASPAVDVIDATGSLVVTIDASAVSMFVESGQVTIHERRDAKPVGAHKPLASGQFLSRGESGKSSVAGRPSPDFITQMPRAYLDTLPDRAEMFKDRATKPKATADISYEDAHDWLAVEWTLRRPAMNRWRPLTSDPEFRKGLIANMKAHPEWDRVLFPENYRRKN